MTRRHWFLLSVILGMIGILAFTGCASVRVNPEPHDIQWLRDNGHLTDIPEGTPSHEHLIVTIKDEK